MDTRGFHRYVDEVRIIIGPKFDMIVKLDNDHDELVFNEELVEHKSEGSLRKSRNIMCISLPVQAKDRRFIFDFWKWTWLYFCKEPGRMNLRMQHVTQSFSIPPMVQLQLPKKLRLTWEPSTWRLRPMSWMTRQQSCLLGSDAWKKDIPSCGLLERCLSSSRNLGVVLTWRFMTASPTSILEQSNVYHMIVIWLQGSMNSLKRITSPKIDLMILTMLAVHPEGYILMEKVDLKCWTKIKMILTNQEAQEEEEEEKKVVESEKTNGITWRGGRGLKKETNKDQQKQMRIKKPNRDQQKKQIQKTWENSGKWWGNTRTMEGSKNNKIPERRERRERRAERKKERTKERKQESKKERKKERKK